MSAIAWAIVLAGFLIMKESDDDDVNGAAAVVFWFVVVPGFLLSLAFGK